MGVPTTGGARGSISIDTSQLNRAQASVNAFSNGVNTSLTGMNPAINKAQNAVGGLAASFGQLGVSFGVAQLGRFTLEADTAATAFRRQSVAALHLAGSQGNLNALMEAYDKATGGAVDRATALSNVVRLQAVGFADSAEELSQFARVARGISIAMGSSQDYIISQLQLAIANQSTMRLDQLGLGVTEVKNRIDQLKTANKDMTDEMAYQQAILGLAEEKYGALADSAESAATGAERAAKSFKDVRLAWGELTGGTVGFAGNALSEWLQQATKDAEFLRLVLVDIGQAIGVLPRSWESSWNPAKPVSGTAPWGTRGAPPGTGASAASPIIEGEAEAKMDWARGVNDINKQLHDDIISAEADYGRSRAATVRSYQRGVAREERDFSRNRLRANLDFLDSVADVGKDAARRESKAQADFDRSQIQAAADSAESIADARKDAAERLLDLEQEYADNREKAAAAHRDSMLDAAGRLDAHALYEEQRNYARESKEAEKAHNKQRKELAEALDERIVDEQKNFEKSRRQAQEAFNRQREDARAADAERIADMRADFAQRKAREDEDRSIRKSDQAQDYADQLAEMDAAHGLRMGQIRVNALREREQLQIEHEAEMVRLGAADAAMKARVLAREKVLTDSYDRYWDHVEKRTKDFMKFLDETTPRTLIGGPVKAYAEGGYVGATGLALVHAGEYITPASQTMMGGGGHSSSRSINVMAGAININESLRPGDTALEVESALIRILEREAA